MNILIFGASGYIGSVLKKTLESQNHNVFGTYNTFKKEYENDKSFLKCSFEDEKTVLEVLDEAAPDVVISCVRGDFNLQMKAHLIIAHYLLKHSKKIIYFSTANVFDGETALPHFENDTPKPKTDYGKFKAECEKMLKNKLGENCVIVRIPQVWGKNSPRTKKLISDAKNGRAIETISNTFLNYATEKEIAGFVSYILKNNLKGTFHIGTEDMCSLTEFQKRLLSAMNFKNSEFKEETEEKPYYLAVLRKRKDIPKNLYMSINDIIQYLKTEPKNDF